MSATERPTFAELAGAPPAVGCPECGCRDCRPAGLNLRVCRHCGRTFPCAVPQAAPPIVPTPPPPLFIPEAGPPVDGTIYYRPVRCPQCGSKETVVTKKKKDSPIRYHRCEACKATFKSVET